MPQFAAGAADALLRLLRKVEVHQVNRGQIMERQNCNIKEIMESRRHAVDESLHTISVAELNALADELFPDFDHPFLEKFVGVINDPEAAAPSTTLALGMESRSCIVKTRISVCGIRRVLARVGWNPRS
jgi:hypothetical protein